MNMDRGEVSRGLVSWAEHLEEQSENANFTRRMMEQWRRGKGLEPVPDDQAECVTIQLACDDRYYDEIEILVKLMREAAWHLHG
jgi:hypothetical protein